MKINAAAFTLALGLLVISQYASASTLTVPKISETDEAQIDTIAASLFVNLKKGNAEIAVNQYFASSSLMQSKAEIMQLLASQIAAGQRIYGKIGECQETERVTEGSFVEYRTYICQHDNYLSQWNLTFFNTSKGWIGANLAFKDQPANSD